jgi:CRP/FNR family cyclic AMP-dependent transcriptional regulator
MMGMVYMVFKAHGKNHPLGIHLERKTLDFYACDIFGLQDVKIDSLLLVLSALEYVHVDDKDETNVQLVAKNIGAIKTILTHLNTERYLEENKKLRVSAKCEAFLDKILEHIKKVNPNVEAIEIVLNQILLDFKEKNVIIGIQDLADAENQGICGEPLVDDSGTIRLQVDVTKLKTVLPMIKFNTALKNMNKDKQNYS